MITDLLHPNELAHLKNLQLLARNRVEGFCSGLHRSPNKGHSVEFREHRPYSRGDELRTIDWKVFAKSDRLYIRQYEEETNLRCHILVDTSGSMGYSGNRAGGVSKYKYASKLACGLAYLMLNQQDSVGLATFDEKLGGYLTPRGRATQLSRIAGLLLETTHTPPTTVDRQVDLTTTFADLIPRLRRGGLVVVLSDCFGDVPSLVRGLAQFRQAKNDCVVFQVLDRDELEFPFRGTAEFRSLEASHWNRRVDAARLRNAYLQKLHAFQNQLSSELLANRIELVQAVTTQPFASCIASFLYSRRQA